MEVLNVMALDNGFDVDGAGGGRVVSVTAARSLTTELLGSWYLFTSGMSYLGYKYGTKEYIAGYCWNIMLASFIVAQFLLNFIGFWILILETLGVDTHLNYIEKSSNSTFIIFILLVNLNSMLQCLVLFLLLSYSWQRMREPLLESSVCHCAVASKEAIVFTIRCCIPVVAYAISFYCYGTGIFAFLYCCSLLCQIFVTQLAFFILSMDSFHCQEQINRLIDLAKEGELTFKWYLEIKDAIHVVKRRNILIRDGLIVNAYVAVMLLAMLFYFNIYSHEDIGDVDVPFVSILFYLAIFTREILLLFVCMPKIAAINDASAQLSHILIHYGTVEGSMDYNEVDRMEKSRMLIWASNNDKPIGYAVLGGSPRSKSLRHQLGGALLVFLVGIVKFAVVESFKK